MSGTTTVQSPFSIGRDCTVVLVGPGGVVVELSQVTGFSSQQQTYMPRVKALNGNELGRNIPGAWTGTFDIERGSDAADTLANTVSLLYYNGSNQDWIGTIYQYVAEADGSTSTFQWNNVLIHFPNMGNWSADTSVKLRLEFWAAQRIIVS